MKRNIGIEWHESGLIIGLNGLYEFVTVPEILKTHFYETLLDACLSGEHDIWTDLDGNSLLIEYEHRNHFNCFINGLYAGDMAFILLSETSIAIPVYANGAFDYFEVYDTRIMQCYLLEKDEVLRLAK